MYRLNILTNNFDIRLETNMLYFDNNINYLLNNYSKNTLINGNNFNILYLANTSLPQISGYTIRTKYILNEIKK